MCRMSYDLMFLERYVQTYWFQSFSFLVLWIEHFACKSRILRTRPTHHGLGLTCQHFLTAIVTTHFENLLESKSKHLK